MKKKDYVSFEVAKLLKEKGYDEYCEGYFHLNTEEATEEECFEMAPGQDFRNRDNRYRVGAPTLYEAQKWLRKKHHIHIVIDFNGYGWYCRIYDITSGDFLLQTKGYKDNYVEALNIGILEALKIIRHEKENTKKNKESR